MTRASASALAALLPLLLALPGAAHAAAPRAVVTQSIIDVGRVPRGEDITVEFSIQNNGDADLEITEVKPSCGCTVASFASNIKPGRVGKVIAVLTTKDFRGPIAKSVTVFTNDTASPRLNLVIKAIIQPQIEVEPSYSRFVVVLGEEYGSSSHELRAADESDFEIVKVNSPYPFLKVSYGRPPAGGDDDSAGDWRVDLALGAEAPVGALADYVVVETTHPSQKQVRIPVSGFVRPPVAVVPEIFDFGRREVVEPFPARVEVKVLSSKPLKLGEVAVDVPGMAAEIEVVEQGRLYNLLLELGPDMAKGATEGLVSISTNSAELPVIEIPVTGTVL